PTIVTTSARSSSSFFLEVLNMRRLTLSCSLLAVLGLVFVDWVRPPAAGEQPGDPPPVKKFADFDSVIKGAKDYEGLFHLYSKEDQLYAEILPNQLDKPMLCPIAIARGMSMGGHTLNFDEQWVLVFRRVGDKSHLLRRN